MPECEICWEEVDNVYECKSCGILFCPQCGSVKDELCRYCLEETE